MQLMYTTFNFCEIEGIPKWSIVDIDFIQLLYFKLLWRFHTCIDFGGRYAVISRWTRYKKLLRYLYGQLPCLGCPISCWEAKDYYQHWLNELKIQRPCHGRVQFHASEGRNISRNGGLKDHPTSQPFNSIAMDGYINTHSTIHPYPVFPPFTHILSQSAVPFL